MKIAIDKQDGITVFHIQGNLDAESVAQFKRSSTPVLEEGCVRLVIDCQRIDFMDSMGLGALISLLRRVRTQAGDIKLSGLNKEVRSVFEITRLHRLFDICSDWKTACQKF